MPTDADFLAAIAAHPADDTPRLVYADWLDDRGDADRAAYLRAAVEMTQLCGDGRPEGPAVDELLRLGAPLPQEWKQAAAGLFSAALFGHEAGYKITVIKLVREVSGRGLAESKALVECLPARVVDRVHFEAAHAVVGRLRQPPTAVAAVLLTHAPLNNIAGLSYRLVAYYWDASEYLDVEPPPGPEVADALFREFLSAAARVSPQVVAGPVHQHRALLISEVRPADVAGLLDKFRKMIPAAASTRGVRIEVTTEAMLATA